MNTSMIEFEINATCTDVLQQSRYYSLTLYLPNTEYLFIFLFQLIIGCTIVNNILTIQTCLCTSIRITNLGVYLIFLSLIKSVKCIEFGTVLITCLIHILSSLFVLRNISVHKVYINSGEEKYWVVWRQQMRKHMNFFIPPLCYILCIVPWYLFKHVIYSCDRIGPTMTLRLYLILITLANIPFTMTFAIYIYPSNVYINEFKRSLIVLMTKVFRYEPQRERTDSNLSNVTQIYTI
ncbi:unnamed protein product [Adineta steineri]|uniref:Uncharacterized protein n=1 Tax=Adineta steineri TaxID=433720 RepID=A0A814MIT2_9BILA|nr:unnamed protein product [Adineta steineri]CAF4031540.1 unnamed protein product [Adineta steineri]